MGEIYYKKEEYFKPIYQTSLVLICERVSEYGCVEKYFSKPNWSVNYADIIQMHEPQQLGLVADVEVKYNE